MEYGPETNIWIERLALFDLARLMFQGTFRNLKLFYDEHTITSLVQRALPFLKKAGMCKNIHPAKLAFDKKDSDGYSINYSMNDNLFECMERFASTHFSRQSAAFQGMVKQYLQNNLRLHFVFISMVEAQTAFQRRGAAKNIFYLSKHPLNYIVVDYFVKKGYLFKESVMSWSYIKYFLRHLYLMIVILLEKFVPRRVETNIKIIRPSIWIEYCHNSDIDFSFWRNALLPTEADIVYYFDRADDPPTALAAAVIDKQNDQWINLHFKQLIKLSNLPVRTVWSIAIRAMNSPGYSRPWFRLFMLEYSLWRALFTRVYSHFNVKILIQHQESTWTLQPQTEAIEDAGGIMLGFHWSCFPFYKEALFNPMHVYFVWGRLIRDCIRKKGHTCRYILPSGLWLISKKTKYNELELFKRSLKFIIAFFDNTVSYNTSYTPEGLSQFYLMVLDSLKEHPEWGGVVKSKNRRVGDFETLPEGQKIAASIAELIAQKRLVVLDPHTFPFIASQYAHLSVAYGLSSAAVISGIYGHRVIQCDTAGCFKHPFFRNPEQKIVFPDLQSCREAIINASHGNAGIGDFSTWRKHCNYFDDTSAPSRVAGFIHDFLTQVHATNDVSSSLDTVTKKYLIDNKITDDFSQPPNLWDEDWLSVENSCQKTWRNFNEKRS